MEHIELLKELCGEPDGSYEDWHNYLAQRPRLRDILEEYVLVSDAFENWSQIKGLASNEAREYQRLIQERSDEIKAFVRSKRTLHKNHQS